MRLFARLFLLLFCLATLAMPAAYARDLAPSQMATADHCQMPADATADHHQATTHDQTSLHAGCSDCLICAGSCLPPASAAVDVRPLSFASIRHAILIDTFSGIASPPELKPPRS